MPNIILTRADIKAMRKLMRAETLKLVRSKKNKRACTKRSTAKKK
jgi:hypothetical protein